MIEVIFVQLLLMVLDILLEDIKAQIFVTQLPSWKSLTQTITLGQMPLHLVMELLEEMVLVSKKMDYLLQLEENKKITPQNVIPNP